MVFNLADDEWDDVIRVHLRGTFVVSRPACRHWRAQAKEHGTTYGRLINTATGLLALRRRGPVELRRREGRDQRVHRGGRDRDGAVRRDGQRDHARRQHAARADRLADGAGDRRKRAATPAGSTHATRCTSRSSAASSRRRRPAGISGQTFQVHGGTIEHVGTWRVEQHLAARRPRLHRRRPRGRAPARRPAQARRPPTPRVDRRPQRHRPEPPITDHHVADVPI